jgi:hypothetical protein
MFDYEWSRSAPPYAGRHRKSWLAAIGERRRQLPGAEAAAGRELSSPPAVRPPSRRTWRTSWRNCNSEIEFRPWSWRTRWVWRPRRRPICEVPPVAGQWVVSTGGAARINSTRSHARPFQKNYESQVARQGVALRQVGLTNTGSA